MAQVIAKTSAKGVADLSILSGAVHGFRSNTRPDFDAGTRDLSLFMIREGLVLDLKGKGRFKQGNMKKDPEAGNAPR